jgi:hypothetical protein
MAEHEPYIALEEGGVNQTVAAWQLERTPAPLHRGEAEREVRWHMGVRISPRSACSERH